MKGDQREVVPWLQSFDLFALPSYANEGVPQALVQAMLCGLACVTTDIGAIGEAAIDGETALVVPPRDADSLARAIGRLAENAAACVRCRAPSGRSRARRDVGRRRPPRSVSSSRTIFCSATR